MKLFFAFFVMSSLLVQGSYANEIQDENIYISPSQVLIGQNGIFVKYEDTVISVPSIACDAQGIYFNSSLRASDGDNAGDDWSCSYCSAENSSSSYECWKCGTSKRNTERHSRDD